MSFEICHYFTADFVVFDSWFYLGVIFMILSSFLTVKQRYMQTNMELMS